MKKELKNKIFFFFKIAVTITFFYFLFTKFVDIKSVIMHVRNIKYYLLFLCFFITLLTLFLRAIRWKLVTRLYKKQISFKDALKLYLKSIYYGSVTPAKAGEFIRGYVYAKNYNISRGDGFSSVFFERVFDIFFSLIFVCTFFLFGRVLNLFTSLLISLVLIIILWLFLVYLSKYIVKYAKKIKFLKRLTIPKIKFDYAVMLNGLLTVCIWFLFSLIGMIVLYSMNVYTVPLYYLFFAICVVNIAILIPITPNGWGLREGTYVFLLSQFTNFISPEKSLLFSVIFVLLTTYFLALIGLILEFTIFHRPLLSRKGH